eukprot:m.165206 g.165206  ORF g.165206 m.165206 type:complete len:68 (-) comp16589_c1_seq9:1406-1609(-)
MVGCALLCVESLALLSLTEAELIQKVVEATPHTDIVLLAQTMPSNYVQPMLVFLAKELDHSRHVGTC